MRHIGFKHQRESKQNSDKYKYIFRKQTLDKAEDANKNGQFRDTDTIGYTRHRTKTNKANTNWKQHKKEKTIDKHRPRQSTGNKLMCSRRISGFKVSMPVASIYVHPRFFDGVSVAQFKIKCVCVVLLCVFTFWVSCCYDFRIKLSSFRLNRRFLL